MNFKYQKTVEKVQHDEILPQVEDIDETAETILDCIMNNHYISKTGQQYVEDLLPLKPYAPNCLKVDLYEKTEKDKVSRFLLIFKSHQAAKNWDYQSKLPVLNQPRVIKRSEIFENLLYIFTDGGRSTSVYLEYISEFIEQQPVCILQHSLSEKALYDSKSMRFYYQVHWQFKGHMPNQNQVVQEVVPKKDDIRYMPPLNYQSSKIETKINEDERRKMPYQIERSESDKQVKLEKPMTVDKNQPTLQMQSGESKKVQKKNKIAFLTKEISFRQGNTDDLDIDIQFNF